VSDEGIVRGSRVHLRHPGARDRDEFLERVAASRRLHGRWIAAPASPDAFAAYLRRTRDDDVDALLVCRHEDDAMVGVFNLSQIFYGSFRNAYLGFYAFEPFAGEGYMTEGLDLVLRHAFGARKLHRVEANVQPDNATSLALVRRAGFRLEGFSPRYLKVAGRWRDYERWAITVEDRRRGP
jgi:[ribosomal protein S5]-alanine N-acetyltransferase